MPDWQIATVLQVCSLLPDFCPLHMFSPTDESSTRPCQIIPVVLCSGCIKTNLEDQAYCHLNWCCAAVHVHSQNRFILSVNMQTDQASQANENNLDSIPLSENLSVWEQDCSKDTWQTHQNGRHWVQYHRHAKGHPFITPKEKKKCNFEDFEKEWWMRLW